MKFDYAYLENKKSELSVFQIALIYRNIPLFRAEYEPVSYTHLTLPTILRV